MRARLALSVSSQLGVLRDWEARAQRACAALTATAQFPARRISKPRVALTGLAMLVHTRPDPDRLPLRVRIHTRETQDCPPE